MNVQAFQEAQARDLQTIHYSWEEFDLKMKEFQIACRYAKWDEAEAARFEALAFLEVNFDSFAAMYKRSASV